MATVPSSATVASIGPSSRIQSSPEVCGGKACIAGTRIRVQDIYVRHELNGQSADEIVSQFPQLTMADVYAALSYYWDHRGEIQRQMADAESIVAELKSRSPSALREKLAKANGQDDQGPS